MGSPELEESVSLNMKMASAMAAYDSFILRKASIGQAALHGMRFLHLPFVIPIALVSQLHYSQPFSCFALCRNGTL